MPQMPDPGPEPQPELCFCMVRAIGTDLAPIENGLTRKLLEAKFVPKKIKLSDEIAKQTLVQDLVKGITNQYRRYDALMTAGDVLRSCTGRPEAAAVLAMEAIQAERPHLRKVAEERGNRGVAFILSSLMGRAEVRSLRDVYGPRLFVISAYSHTDSRRNRLRDSLTASAVEMNQDVDELVEELMARDRGRSYDESALLSRVIDVAEHRILSIDKTFDLGDFFVDADAPPARIEEDVERLLALILSSPKHTPTKPEMGMAHAYSARLRSSSLSRQVGAAICDDDGNLLVTGTNEVPKAGGGQYWIDDPEPPKRDIEIGHDTSDRTRREIFGDLVERLVADPSWLINAIQETMNDGERPDVEQGSKTIEEDARIAEQLRSLMARVDLDLAIDSALSARSVRGAQLFDVVEYGRAAHAEMAAICHAALRGVSIRNATLYCTTFPCHICASLIVAAGIRRVVYIEPYPKSRVPEMYPDSIALAHQEKVVEGRVVFAPFMGVSPLRHADLFSWAAKKVDDLDPKIEKVLTGEIRDWNPETGSVRHTLRMGRADLSRDQQTAVENHERLLIEEYRSQVGTVEDRYVALIRDALLPG
jgi:deoxycytidylate deaminase